MFTICLIVYLIREKRPDFHTVGYDEFEYAVGNAFAMLAAVAIDAFLIWGASIIF